MGLDSWQFTPNRNVNDEFGLDLLVDRNVEKHRMDARFVEFVEPFPDGHLTLAAYVTHS